MSHLLIVDDNEQNRYLLHVLLTGHGYMVTLATDGQDALDKARHSPPDLIITDILMPGMDGYSLIHYWKSDEQLQKIPFVFYTATYTDPKDEQLALSLGANRFIIKPQEPEILLAMVAEVLEEYRAGKLLQPEQPKLEEAIYFKQYNEVLIHKLEDKLVELETAKASLEREIEERKQREHEREELEDQLRQAQKMESVGRLAGGVAHDFNNMLQAIMGFTYLALEEIPPDTRLRRYITEIQTAAERSADLTRQLLAFARKQTIKPKVLDPNETIAGMLKMLQRLIGEDINLVWKPGINLGQVKIDPSQFDQILANLAVNARDAISGAGKISIETGNKRIDDAFCSHNVGITPGEYIRISVYDDGCGMDTHILENIFEPFFTTKGPGEGTGLGLSTVYGIVKQNQGSITVNSQTGQGSSFHIYLPRYQSEENETTPKDGDTTAPVMGHETVLIVEDEEAILSISQAILERLGYTVLTANSTSQALQKVVEHDGDIHLLLTDVVMPEMNGKDLAEKIKDHFPDIKILFMSGYTSNVIANNGILDDGVTILQKPFSRMTLAVKVRETLDICCAPPVPR